jgi:hypothetical protein
VRRSAARLAILRVRPPVDLKGRRYSAQVQGIVSGVKVRRYLSTDSAEIASGVAGQLRRMSLKTYSALAEITRSANGGGWARKMNGQ